MKKLWKIKHWLIIKFQPCIFVINYFLFLSCIISSDVNSHGGQLSFFLHVVKTPLEIFDVLFVEEIEFPYNLGSLSSFPKELLLKSILTSFPKIDCFLNYL